MRTQIAKRWIDLGGGHSQRIQEVYVEDGKIVLGLEHAYSITLTTEQAKELIRLLNLGIEALQ